MNRKSLLEALNVSKSCLAQHPMVPILSHFCFNKKEIISFNGTQALSIDYKSDLNCAIPGDLFFKLVSTFVTDSVEVEQQDKNILVSSGGHVSKLATLPPTEFLFKMPSIEKLPSITINDDLIEGVKRCMMSVNDNPVIKNQYGITLDNKATGTTLYSTDAIRLSRYSLKNSLSRTSFKILLPKLFSALLTILGSSYSGKLYIGDDFIYADFGTVRLYSKIIKDINFLPFEETISQYLNDKTKFQPIPDGMFDILNRALIFLSQEIDQFVSMVVKGNEMSIHTQCSIGLMDETLLFPKPLIDNKEYKFPIDAKYLEEGAINTKEVAFVYVNKIAAFIMREGGFYYLLNSPNV